MNYMNEYNNRCMKCNKGNHNEDECIIQSFNYYIKKFNLDTNWELLHNLLEKYEYVNIYLIIYLNMGSQLLVKYTGDSNLDSLFMHGDHWGQYGEELNYKPIYDKFILNLNYLNKEIKEIYENENLEIPEEYEYFGSELSETTEEFLTQELVNQTTEEFIASVNTDELNNDNNLYFDSEIIDLVDELENNNTELENIIEEINFNGLIYNELFGEINLDITVKCPMCRTINYKKEIKNIKGLKEICCICYDKKIEKYFPICEHACICSDCFNKL